MIRSHYDGDTFYVLFGVGSVLETEGGKIPFPCRPRLEFYEQACAVDSDTQRCAGSTAECRRAVLGILGTQLRNLCTCAASDPRETFTCMDWLRILWHNPCVGELSLAQRRVSRNAVTQGTVFQLTGIL